MNYSCVFCFQGRPCLGSPRGPRRQPGFTLVELILALAIAATLIGLAVPLYSSRQEEMKINQAINDMRLIELKIQRFYTVNFRYPNALSELTDEFPTVDPWGNAYQYLNIATTKGKGKVRKDRKLNPINSDYDLYSIGKDGRTASPLTAKHSHDDIVRANNGGFVGLASKY